MPDCAPGKTCNLTLVSIYLDNASCREQIHHAVVVCTNTGITKPELMRCWNAIPLYLIKFSFRGRGFGRPTKRKMLMRRYVVRRSWTLPLTRCPVPQKGAYARHIYSIPFQNFFIRDSQTVSKAQNFIETWNRAGLDSRKDGMADYATRVLNCKRKITAHSFDLRRP